MARHIHIDWIWSVLVVMVQCGNRLFTLFLFASECSYKCSSIVPLLADVSYPLDSLQRADWFDQQYCIAVASIATWYVYTAHSCLCTYIYIALLLLLGWRPYTMTQFFVLVFLCSVFIISPKNKPLAVNGTGRQRTCNWGISHWWIDRKMVWWWVSNGWC